MNRYNLNEVSCPVPLETLALLMRSDDAKVAEVVLALSPQKRAELSLYCFGRCHMRSLGLTIGRHCTERALEAVGGAAGQMIFDQGSSAVPFDAGPAQYHKRKVSLARVAA